VANRTETMTRIKDRALELGVYLPLGAYSAVRDEIADIDARQVRKAYNGLIDRGQTRFKPIEKRVRRRSNNAATKAAGAARSAKKTATRTAKKAGAATNGLAPKLPRVATPKKASDLPIQNYGSLTAGEVTSRLRGLTQTDLAKVYKFERANENRTTILEAIESRFVQLPIPTYDSLTADEIVDRLDRLSEGELKTIRRYESDTKERGTVIEKIDALLAA
jgi:hypothetical protein